MEKVRMLILIVSWSVYYVLCDQLIETLKSPYIVGMALRVGTVSIMTIFFILSRKFYRFVVNRDSFFLIIGVAFLSFLFDCLINIGLQFSTASSGSALLKTELLFVLIISAFNKKIVLKSIDYVLAFAVTIGSILIICEDILSFNVDVYSLLFVISAIINSVCAFIIQKLQLRFNVSSYQIAYTSNIVNLLMYTLISTIITSKGYRPYFNSTIFGMLLICVLCQSIIVLIYYDVLGLYSVWIVKTLLLSVPIITLFLQIIILNEYPTISQIIGVFITVLSAMMLVLRHNYTSSA